MAHGARTLQPSSPNPYLLLKAIAPSGRGAGEMVLPVVPTDRILLHFGGEVRGTFERRIVRVG